MGCACGCTHRFGWCSRGVSWPPTPAPGAPAPPARPCRSRRRRTITGRTDFKGEFRLGNRRWCYPLTVTDQLARFLLMVEALESTQEAPVFTAFYRLFEERGLPAAIRSDVEPEVRLWRNGTPFASRGLYGLSRLSVWWLRLGIRIERITPGRPRETRCPRAHAPHADAGDLPARRREQPARARGASTTSGTSSTTSVRTRPWA